MLRRIWDYFQKEGEKVREKKMKEHKLKPTDYSFLSKKKSLLDDISKTKEKYSVRYKVKKN